MRTRAALIDGGLRLAEEMGLAGVSVNVLVAELGVSKGTFFHHFGSRANYLLALHREFHERLEKVMVAAVVDHPPGRDHLLAGTHAYLDACLRDRGVKALLLEARAEPLIIGEVSARNARNAGLAEPDFRALGWRHPARARRCGSGSSPRPHCWNCTRVAVGSPCEMPCGSSSNVRLPTTTYPVSLSCNGSAWLVIRSALRVPRACPTPLTAPARRLDTCTNKDKSHELRTTPEKCVPANLRDRNLRYRSHHGDIGCEGIRPPRRSGYCGDQRRVGCDTARDSRIIG